MPRNNLGLLVIDIKSDMLDENGEISLATAQENHWDAIVELIKNPKTTKLRYLTFEETNGFLQGSPTRPLLIHSLAIDLDTESITSVGLIAVSITIGVKLKLETIEY